MRQVNFIYRLLWYNCFSFSLIKTAPDLNASPELLPLAFPRNSTLFVLIFMQITKALKNIRNAIKMDMNQSLYLNLLALVLSSQKKVGICVCRGT